MMDVVYFAPFLDTGGTQRHLLELCLALDRERFRPLICCLNGGGGMESVFADSALEVRNLRVGSRFFSPQAMRALGQTVSWLRSLRPAVVHAYQCRPSIFATIAGRLAGVPVVITSKRGFGRQNAVLEAIWRYTNRWVTTVLVNSRALARQVGEEGVGSRVVIIPCGVNVESFHPRQAVAAKERLGLDRAAVVVGSVGRLIEHKGYRYLLEAAAILCAQGKRIELLLVGDGPDRGSFTDYATELGINRQVHFLGERTDVQECVAAMDVFALPSLSEGMSNALLEAMAMAKPVVVSDGPSNPEVVRHGSSGLVVKAGRARDLAEALWLIISDGALAVKLGVAARARVEAEFSQVSMVSKFEDLYISLVGKAESGLRGGVRTQERLV